MRSLKGLIVHSLFPSKPHAGITTCTQGASSPAFELAQVFPAGERSKQSKQQDTEPGQPEHTVLITHRGCERNHHRARAGHRDTQGMCWEQPCAVRIKESLGAAVSMGDTQRDAAQSLPAESTA